MILTRVWNLSAGHFHALCAFIISHFHPSNGSIISEFRLDADLPDPGQPTLDSFKQDVERVVQAIEDQGGIGGYPVVRGGSSVDDPVLGVCRMSRPE